jgi:hypothetical protein
MQPKGFSPGDFLRPLLTDSHSPHACSTREYTPSLSHNPSTSSPPNLQNMFTIHNTTGARPWGITISLKPLDGGGPSIQREIKYRLSDLLVELIEGFSEVYSSRSWKIEKGE